MRAMHHARHPPALVPALPALSSLPLSPAAREADYDEDAFRTPTMKLRIASSRQAVVPPRLFLCLLTASVLFLPLSLSASEDTLALCLQSRESGAAPPLSHALLCPSHCLSVIAAAGLSAAGRVWGSYPYHVNSSLCLAAVHAGVLDETKGGWVFISPFYPQDWSSGPSQSIFPFSSADGRLSNRVLSSAVPADWFAVPSPLGSFSFIPRGRGEWVVQRRTAPFSPRARHVHVSFDVSLLPVLQLVVGGYSAAGYSNDVWVFVQVTGFERWDRASAAPFSPRADVSWALDSGQSGLVQLFFFGGQTGHACGLHELGVCSCEVWRLSIRVDSLRSTYSLQWSSQPLYSLPFPVCRCGLSLLSDLLAQGERQLLRVGLLGGQLSYSDASCVAQAESVSELWLSADASQQQTWQRAADPPFEARRSMQREDALLNLGQVNSRTVWMPGSALVGGYRCLNHSSDGLLPARGRLTRLELFADAWVCEMAAAPSLRCKWGWLQSNQSSPTAALPLAVSSGPSLALHPRYMGIMPGWIGIRIGGASSQEAMDRWMTSSIAQQEPHSSSVANLSVLLRPLPGTDSEPDFETVERIRHGLPSTVVIEEVELNDPLSAWQLGMDWVLSFSLSASTSLQMIGLHQQSHALAVTPSQASPYLPQAASSLNTSRPLFNFVLRRLQPGFSSGWSLSNGRAAVVAVLSGGRSGSHFTADWITVAESQCFQADDPSYLAALGPMVVMGAASPRLSTFAAGTLSLVACAAGHHFEPAVLDEQIQVVCSPHALWLDLSLQAIRRCVPSIRRCPAPWTDEGFEDCSPPQPILSSIRVTPGVNVDELTVMDVPRSRRTLEVVGQWLTQPLRVLVGGYGCAAVEVQQASVHCINLTASSRLCESFISRFICQVPPLSGTSLPVTVLSGSSARLAISSSANGSRVATLSSTPPVIIRIRAEDCRPNGALELAQCPVTRPFNLSILVLGSSLPSSDFLSVNVYLAAVRLQCFPPRDLHQDLEVVCSVLPQVGRGLQLRVQYEQLDSLQSAFLSFQVCPAGYATDYSGAARGALSLCSPCQPGYSTDNSADQAECQPCKPGSFANSTGQAACLACPRGQYSSQLNASACQDCPPNSWQPSDGQSGCEVCSLNSFIHLPSPRSPLQTPECRPCPRFAFCSPSGNISAQRGSYLLIDQSQGLVISVACAATACVDASSGFGSQAQLIEASKLKVWNRCAEGRHPAYDSANSALAATDGINVLCAHCLPGFSQVNGRCIECAAPQYGWLLALLLPSLLLVYCVHRLPHDWGGSATVSICSYFVQLSAIFLSASAVVPLSGLVTLSFSGDYYSGSYQDYSAEEQSVDGEGNRDWYLGACVLPLSDMGRLGVQLIVPLIAFALLAVLAVMERLAGKLIGEEQLLRPSSLAGRAHRLLWTQSEDSGNSLDDHKVANPIRLLSPGSSLSPLSGQSGCGSLRLYQRTAVRLLLLSYTAVALTSLSFFRYQSVGQFGKRVVDYPTLDPQSSEYKTVLPLIVVLLCVVCLAPAALTLYLFLQHRSGRLLSLDRTRAADDHDGSDETSSAQRALLLQLTAMCPRWWLPPALIIRRLLLAAIFVAVDGSTVWTWLTTCNWLLLIFHFHFRPYVRPSDNAVETLCLISLALQTTLRIRWPPPATNAQLLAAQGALILGPVLLLLWSACRARFSGCRSLQRKGGAHREDLSMQLLDSTEADEDLE